MTNALRVILVLVIAQPLVTAIAFWVLIDLVDERQLLWGTLIGGISVLVTLMIGTMAISGEGTTKYSWTKLSTLLGGVIVTSLAWAVVPPGSLIGLVIFFLSFTLLFLDGVIQRLSQLAKQTKVEKVATPQAQVTQHQY